MKTEQPDEKGEKRNLMRRLGLGKTLCVAGIVGLLMIGTVGAFYSNATNHGESSISSTGENTGPNGGSNGSHPQPPPGGNGSKPHPPPPLPDNFTYIVVTPMLLKLNISDAYTFMAVAYDVKGNIIPGLTFAWSVGNCPQPKNGSGATIGTIDQNGQFTAKANGFGCVIAETDYKGKHIVGHAFVQVGDLPPPPPPKNGSNPHPPPHPP